MDALDALIVDGVAFGRTLIGLVFRPYETYRRIVTRGRRGELLYIGLLLAGYFALASIVKVAAFRPFLLTQQFALLTMGAISGVALSALSMWFFGRVFRVSASFMSILLAWGYTLVPTVIWFISTSLLYVLLPPPRTTSLPGIMFSLLFLAGSATLLWWKVTLAYLTLRFSLRVDFVKGVIIAVLCAPVIALWSVGMYRAGVFRIPFL